MLKSYKELREIDVMPFCEYKDAKDDKGKAVKIPYLNWAKCKDILHENGAESVYFTPIANPEGSFVFRHSEVQNKDGRKGGCYFVKVEIHIDDKVYTMDTPLMNGSLVVYEDTLNQLRIANAHARAFVKGVAIHTGLGFSLWSDTDEDVAAKNIQDDLGIHDILAVKKRVQELVTAKLANGLTKDDILSSLKLSAKGFDTYMAYYDSLFKFETALKKL